MIMYDVHDVNDVANLLCSYAENLSNAYRKAKVVA